MYHGTHRDRGNRILANGKMEYSQGNHEWLGDGIYLYRDKLYAYRWLTIQYNKHYPSGDLSDLLNYYMILHIEINYNYERIFSFLNPEHKIEFINVKEKCRSKAKVINRMLVNKITDGVILNIMFKEMGYGDNYDMVEAIFPLVDEKDENSRLNGLYEYQLCVKNPENIVKIEDGTEAFNSDVYNEKVKMFNGYRSSFKEKNNTYKKRRRGYRYGK